MKVCSNNQLNKVLFIYNNELLDNKTFTANFYQVGSNGKVTLPTTVDFSDCYTVLFNIELAENALKNARHLLKIEDQDGIEVFSTTVKVDGNTDEIKGYIVIDSD